MKRLLASALLYAASSIAADNGLVGSRVCEKCHAEIYRKYSRTAMAQTSGLALHADVPEQSFSANGGYEYSISRGASGLSLQFRKPGVISGSRELSYYAGSGATARSYLISVDGFLYEAPATYYTSSAKWAPSPGYDSYNYPFLTRGIAPACLQCHATGIREIAGTQNGFESPPFVEPGIGCERCHGPGAAHAASAMRSDIVNPATLEPRRRDSVCAQCHLSGEIRVDRAGKSSMRFAPGELLSDYAIAFVRQTRDAGIKVNSHVESLTRSACARGSGDRLWCGTCHDPHSVPAASEKVAWFRSRCQTCHTPAQCARGENCIACHMPRTEAADADHVVYTDHSIPRRPIPRNRKPPADAPLTAFGGVRSGPRDLGLAYAIVALRESNPAYSARAFDLLREAQRQSEEDPETLAYLADLYVKRSDDASARALYERLYALVRAAGAPESSAAAHLGAYQMEQGHYDEAIRLFREALHISPALVLVRMNLAVALIKTGRPGEARPVLAKALEFNPSFTAARELLDQIR
ncbi:MAG TPA: tetratricopeptide repeat protein [Bryobacteraceae bacterium]|nr:tetratricopeptide repeat protein [Bryobacteraceae bacterium]